MSNVIPELFDYEAKYITPSVLESKELAPLLEQIIKYNPLDVCAKKCDRHKNKKKFREFITCHNCLSQHSKHVLANRYISKNVLTQQEGITLSNPVVWEKTKKLLENTRIENIPRPTLFSILNQPFAIDFIEEHITHIFDLDFDHMILAFQRSYLFPKIACH
jgi:hypothetical protein